MHARRVPLEWEMRVPHLNSLHRAKWDWASENLTSVDLGYVCALKRHLSGWAARGSSFILLYKKRKQKR